MYYEDLKDEYPELEMSKTFKSFKKSEAHGNNKGCLKNAGKSWFDEIPWTRFVFGIVLVLINVLFKVMFRQF